jgi:hypothetical protein
MSLELHFELDGAEETDEDNDSAMVQVSATTMVEIPTDSETTIAEATREYVVSLIENDPESFFEESTIESEVVETRREGSNSASEEANDD